MEKQLGLPIKILRLDQDEEYLSNEFLGYFVENEIVSQLTMLGTLQ